jgi:Fic family protein
MDNINDKLEKIDSLKSELVKFGPIENISKNWFYTTTIYNSKLLQIEKERSFTYQEINNLIERSKQDDCFEHEYLEIIDHKKAIDYIYELSKNNITGFNSNDILNIHSILFKNICPNIAGKYRDGPIWIELKNGGQIQCCDNSLILGKLGNYFQHLLSIKDENPLFIAGEVHNEFVRIHPFFDGNGRTGRLLMNLTLLQKKYVPVIILAKYREKYEEAISLWPENKDAFYNIIADSEINSLETCLREKGKFI